MAREPRNRYHGNSGDTESGVDRGTRRVRSRTSDNTGSNRSDKRIERRPVSQRSNGQGASGERSRSGSGNRSVLENYTGPSAAGLERVNSRVKRRAAGAHSKAAKPSTRILLIAGVVLILIALVIAIFLIVRYTSADQKNTSFVEAAGLDTQVDEVATDTDPDAININWEALRRINSDVVGWVMIPGTRVNYPIVQTVDNDYYLTRMFDKSANDSGAIFLDYESDPKMQGRNNMMYGHNMLDGSMFAALREYQDQAFYDAHKTILLFTPEKNYKLEVVSVLLCEAEDKIRQVNFADAAAYQTYVNMLLDYAVLNEIDPTALPDGIYCLATCTGFDNSKRFVVLAKDTGEGVSADPAAQTTDGGSDPAATGDAAGDPAQVVSADVSAST